MRGSFIPLSQRILLNFIWNAVQCWNGGRLVAVCLTAIWPSYARMPNTFSPNFPATTDQFVGFVVFWFISTPFLWLRPEKFKIPFLIVCLWCGIGMLAWMIWAVTTAKGVGPLWNAGENIPSGSAFGTSWLIMAGINQSLGGIAAGITNGSDFSRYSRGRTPYMVGTITSCVITSVIVSLVGLVTTASGQKLYGEIYWNPPDLLMRMMDNGNGSSKARAGVFFLAAGFAFTAMFENICGNAVSGGIDLAGLFPRYINIRRGAIITFVAAWVVQPWQLINRFFISAFVFYVLNKIFPVLDMDQIDPIDLYGTFTEAEAKRAGVAPLDNSPVLGGVSGRRSTEDVVIYGEKCA
ncbi:uncharacterized protein J4E78_004771 [Alternaria triticimaculans]|uniref:uncharacterized protein n=1 Tax=Alternaria triticimaculans TaxID=297637 RepID=UPI0020C2ABC2|nr:uncharacterized protein J4E78_004771 [Alternaria triticimaculans]KAI4661981.1 hypothetical protein J4E78_004771 [Alternaria triticimaculans]